MDFDKITCDLNVKIYDRGSYCAGIFPGGLVYGKDVESVVERAAKAMKLLLNGFESIDEIKDYLSHRGIDFSFERLSADELVLYRKAKVDFVKESV